MPRGLSPRGAFFCQRSSGRIAGFGGFCFSWFSASQLAQRVTRRRKMSILKYLSMPLSYPFLPEVLYILMSFGYVFGATPAVESTSLRLKLFNLLKLQSR
jgi:hypothetical protein